MAVKLVAKNDSAPWIYLVL